MHWSTNSLLPTSTYKIVQSLWRSIQKMSAATEITVYEAAHKGDYEYVKNEVEKNHSLVKTPDNNLRLLLHWASLSGNIQLVKYLLDLNSPVDPQDDSGATPLLLAASAGRNEVVKRLLKKGANVNHRNEGGHSPLQYACSKGWTDVAELLLEYNADVNVVDTRGATPLHRAASKGNLHIVKLLLSNDELNIDARDNYGNTALHLACEEDRQEEAKLLVELGADLDVTNKELKTPLDYCSRGLAKMLTSLSQSSA